jgi:hypothetical protein
MSMTAAIATGYPAVDFTNSTFVVYGTIATSGNYTTHGDTLDLSVLGVPSGAAPFPVDVYENAASGASQSGWRYVFNFGTTQKNGNVQIFNGTTEYTSNAAYSGTIPATLYFRAVFVKL